MTEEQVLHRPTRNLEVRVQLKLWSLSCSPISHGTHQKQLNSRSKMICHPLFLFSSVNENFHWWPSTPNLVLFQSVPYSGIRDQVPFIYAKCDNFQMSFPHRCILTSHGHSPTLSIWRVWNLHPMILSIKQDLKSVCLCPITLSSHYLSRGSIPITRSNHTCALYGYGF